MKKSVHFNSQETASCKQPGFDSPNITSNQALQESAGALRKNAKYKFLRELNSLKKNEKSKSLIRPNKKYFDLTQTLQESDKLFMKRQASRNEQFNSTMDSLLMDSAIQDGKIIQAEWKDHKLHGNVKILYENGSLFTGVYQNGLRVYGRMLFSNSDQTSKEIISHSEENSASSVLESSAFRSTITHPSLNELHTTNKTNPNIDSAISQNLSSENYHCMYEGGFCGQNFHGKGRLSYINGRQIQGLFENMKFVGPDATITYPNGDVYFGQVDEKLYKHGKGYIFLQNDCKYVGQFEHGSITGFGSYYEKETLVGKGYWKCGELIKQVNESECSSMNDAQTQPTKHYGVGEYLIPNCDRQSRTTNCQNTRSICNTESSQSSSILDLKTKERLYLGINI